MKIPRFPLIIISLVHVLLSLQYPQITSEATPTPAKGNEVYDQESNFSDVLNSRNKGNSGVPLENNSPEIGHDEGAVAFSGENPNIKHNSPPVWIQSQIAPDGKNTEHNLMQNNQQDFHNLKGPNLMQNNQQDFHKLKGPNLMQNNQQDFHNLNGPNVLEDNARMRPPILQQPRQEFGRIGEDIFSNENNIDQSLHPSSHIDQGIVPKPRHRGKIGQNSGLTFQDRYKSSKIAEDLDESSKDLQRILKYVRNEVREDTYGPKEWNSSRLVFKNIRFGRTKNGNIGGTLYKQSTNKREETNGGHSDDRQIINEYKRIRGIIKRQLRRNQDNPTAAVKTTQSNSKREQPFNTQATEFGVTDEVLDVTKENAFTVKTKVAETNEPDTSEGNEEVVEDERDRFAEMKEEHQKPQTEKQQKPQAEKQQKPQAEKHQKPQTEKHQKPEELQGHASTTRRALLKVSQNNINSKINDIGGISHQIDEFGNMLKNNLSNLIKMNLELEAPDSNFALNLERKSLNNNKKRFQSKVFNRKKNPNHNPTKINHFNPKGKYFESGVKKGRYVRSAVIDPVRSNGTVQSHLKIRSKAILSKDSNVSVKEGLHINNKTPAVNKRNHTKFENGKTSSTVRTKYDHNTSHSFPPVRATNKTKPEDLNLTNSDFISHFKSNPYNFYFQKRVVQDQDSKNKTKSFILVSELPPEDSENLLKILESKSAKSCNDSYVEFEASDKVYILNVSSIQKGSLPDKIEIVKMWEKFPWDNVHYVKQRETQNDRNTREFLPDFATVIRRNPFTVGLMLAVSGLGMALVLLALLCMLERRYKNKNSPQKTSSSEEYTKIKPVGRSSISKSSEENNTDSSESEEGLKYSPGGLHTQREKSEMKKVSMNESASEENKKKKKELATKAEKSKKKKHKKQKGLMNRAARFLRRRFSTVQQSDTEGEHSEGVSSEEELGGQTSSSEMDKTSFGRRERLKKFVKATGGQKPAPTRAPKIIAPGLRSTLKEAEPYISQDEISVGHMPAPHAVLKDKIVTTGDCIQIDNMLTKREWDRALYTTHGLATIAVEDDLLEHSPEERRKLDSGKIERMSVRSHGCLGILSKDSSGHSLKSEVGRSLNTADWISRHPRPASNIVLKSRIHK